MVIISTLIYSYQRKKLLTVVKINKYLVPHRKYGKGVQGWM
jgi:hypothetical protein